MRSINDYMQNNFFAMRSPSAFLPPIFDLSLIFFWLARLRLAVSDQNLELLPDYQQRIAVLQELQFIDHTSTVLLKGRVACEVGVQLVYATAAIYADMSRCFVIDQFRQRISPDGADFGERPSTL